MQKATAVICDLDGTLCNCDHRVESALKRNWEKFFAGIPLDTVNHWCLEMMLKYQAEGHTILFVTGRPSNHVKPTLDWLHKHTPFKAQMGHNLFMRSDKDRRPDFIIKEELYQKFIEPRFQVIMGADDKVEIVKLWHRLGIPFHYCGKDPLPKF